MNPLKISEKLYDHYESLEEVKNYYGLLAIYGLVLTAEAGNNDQLLDRCRNILKRFPDEVEHPRYNFPSYNIGGIPSAYMYMKGYFPEKREEVREYAEEMMTAARDSKGIMSNPHHPEKELIWIDVAMAVTPYLLFAGLAFNEEKYIDEAAKQAFLHYEEFLDEDNGLLHQCKNFIEPGVYSKDHWSRGNGWGYIALTELINYLPEDSKHRPLAEKYFKDFSAALLPYQSRRGLWRQEIPFEYSYEETSGTGLILYGYGVGLRRGVLDRETYFEPFKKGVEGLNKICINDDFSIENSCPGCLCPGEGEEKGTVKAYVTLKLPHRDEHHGFAPLMFSMIEAYNNGIKELER